MRDRLPWPQCPGGKSAVGARGWSSGGVHLASAAGPPVTVKFSVRTVQGPSVSLVRNAVLSVVWNAHGFFLYNLPLNSSFIFPVKQVERVLEK